MNLIEKKKYVNISEYIIYMYQTEDLIRAYEFDIDKINEYVIKHIPHNDSSDQEMKMWYEGIMHKMQKQGTESVGHLEELNDLVERLSDLSTELRQSDEEYMEIYALAQPHVNENIKIANGLITNEIQICLNGVYGLLLSRINGKEVSQTQLQSIATFGDVLSFLSFKFKQNGYLSPN